MKNQKTDKKLRKTKVVPDETPNLPQIYLSGAIEGCSKSECEEWRDYVTTKTKGIFEISDPYRRTVGMAITKPFSKETAAKIVLGDKLEILKSDALLVNYLETKRCVGTVMEVLFAWENHIPVVINCSTGFDPSLWFVYHSTLITHDLDEAIQYLLRI
jgi:hypothetical protein